MIDNNLSYLCRLSKNTFSLITYILLLNCRILEDISDSIVAIVTKKGNSKHRMKPQPDNH